MQEIIGTFIFVLFFKIMTDERLHFSKENAINCFVIASAYVASRQIVNSGGAGISTYGACLNPAIAVGISLGAAIQNPV
jgi:glycerol uptake facilitator-like aquaporin